MISLRRESREVISLCEIFTRANMNLFYLSLIMHYLKHALRQRLYRSNNKSIFKTLSLLEAQPWSQNSLNFSTASNEWGTLKIIQIKAPFYLSGAQTVAVPLILLMGTKQRPFHTPSKIKEFHSHLNEWEGGVFAVFTHSCPIWVSLFLCTTFDSQTTNQKLPPTSQRSELMVSGTSSVREMAPSSLSVG